MFSTQEVLEIAKEAEKAIAEKTSRKRRREGSISVELGKDEENIIENVSNDLDSDCIVVL